MCVTRPVGTRGGCGEGWGPCACPGGHTIRLGCVSPWRVFVSQLNHMPPGQAQGPLIHPTPPLVPTGPEQPFEGITAFGRKNSSDGSRRRVFLRYSFVKVH